jgi:hypothetical protein
MTQPIGNDLKKKPKMLCFGKENRFHNHSAICKNCYEYSRCKNKVYYELSKKKAIVINVKGKRKGGR